MATKKKLVTKPITKTGAYTNGTYLYDAPEDCRTQFKWPEYDFHWTGLAVTLNDDDAPLSKVFPAVRCNVEYLAYIAEGDEIPVPAPDQCGFYLMGNMLVPIAFLERVNQALQETMIPCATVLPLQEFFCAEFMASLNVYEKSVLGQCVLALLERGMAPMNFTDCHPEEEAA